MLRVLAFVLPLGLDSFAVAAALGAARLMTAGQRLRISALFMVFEGVMPLIGLGLGATIARAAGAVAGYLAAAALVGLGAWMLLSGDSDEDKAGQLASVRGLAIVGLGVSISLDELAIGFTFGLSRLPAIPVIIAIAVQAFLAAQLGLRLGARISGRLRERAEQSAAIALISLGAVLIIETLAS
jgi:putative Mn2+ efflux pump MntP